MLVMSSYIEILTEATLHPPPRNSSPSLATMQKLCAFYGHPQKTFPMIHVAGTNGKGSVCTKIAKAFELQGLRCGLYTSPHITTFRERIQMSGAMIPGEELTSLLQSIQKSAAALSLTTNFFELTTLAAFLYFQQKQVDLAVIETGIGGTWDPTNVITPLLSIITSIGYDHMEILGYSLEEIAAQKAGIIKDKIPVIIGPDVSKAFMQKVAEIRGSPLYQSSFQDSDYDRENGEVARLGLTLLHPYFPLSSQALSQGLMAKPPCRFEEHEREKKIVLDGAHNPHGLRRLLKKLRSCYPDHRYRFLVNFSKNKELSSCAKLIEEAAEAVHLVAHPHPRLTPREEAVKYFNAKKVLLENSVEEGLLHALAAPTTGLEIVVVTGSFFLMHPARKVL